MDMDTRFSVFTKPRNELLNDLNLFVKLPEYAVFASIAAYGV